MKTYSPLIMCNFAAVLYNYRYKTFQKSNGNYEHRNQLFYHKQNMTTYTISTLRVFAFPRKITTTKNMSLLNTFSRTFSILHCALCSRSKSLYCKSYFNPLTSAHPRYIFQNPSKIVHPPRWFGDVSNSGRQLRVNRKREGNRVSKYRIYGNRIIINDNENGRPIITLQQMSVNLGVTAVWGRAGDYVRRTDSSVSYGIVIIPTAKNGKSVLHI